MVLLDHSTTEHAQGALSPDELQQCSKHLLNQVWRDQVWTDGHKAIVMNYQNILVWAMRPDILNQPRPLNQHTMAVSSHRWTHLPLLNKTTLIPFALYF